MAVARPVEENEYGQISGTAGPCAMVLFGATGDLTMRKLVPALYNLVTANLLPQEFAMVGVALDELNPEEFRNRVIRFLQPEEKGTEKWVWFTQRLYYERGDFADPVTYSRLQDRLAAVDQERKTGGNYLFYLATAPSFFAQIVHQLDRAGLSKQKNAQWRLVVVEQ